MAVVTPIPKSTDASTAEQFRPISLTSNLSKVFEKAVQWQLVDHLKQHGVLSTKQSGFRAGHSCESLLLKVVENWKNAIDESKFTAVAFLDLHKAFDSVRHDILLCKLRDVGCETEPLKWFFSYLVGRMQKVRIGDIVSTPLSVHSGVPQGSVLGPLLFVIYINDLLKSYESRTDVEIECFADDTIVYASGREEGATINKLNAALKEVSGWFAAQSLPLNEKKTIALLVRGERKNTSGQYPIELNGKKLPWSTSARYLGVMVDQHLNWKQQVNKIAKCLSFGIAELNRAKQGLNIRQRVALYHAVIEPHLDYCSSVWSSAGKTLLNSIRVKQRQAIRAILNYRESVREETFGRLGIMEATERWAKRLAVWPYKIRNPAAENVPQYLKDMVKFRDLSSIGLRRPNSIIAFGRTKAGQETLAFRLKTLFRSIEHLVDSSASLTVFRSALWNLQLSD